MTKISNKKYEEIWDDTNLSKNSKNDIKKEIKSSEKKIKQKKYKKVNNEIDIKKDEISITEIQKDIILDSKIVESNDEKYIDNGLYKIYYRGSLIYDSLINQYKPEFFDNYFILYGKTYLYRGIRIEKY
jgi:hypothetical protein